MTRRFFAAVVAALLLITCLTGCDGNTPAVNTRNVVIRVHNDCDVELMSIAVSCRGDGADTISSTEELVAADGSLLESEGEFDFEFQVSELDRTIKLTDSAQLERLNAGYSQGYDYSQKYYVTYSVTVTTADGVEHDVPNPITLAVRLGETYELTLVGSSADSLRVNLSR